MLVSYRWLESYTDVPWDPEELAERLTMSGTKVEAIHYPGKGLENVVVGVIQSVGPHPSADGLHVCEVSVGDRTLTTVTGAPVVTAGWKVPVALPGAQLPGLDRTIQIVEVQGVRSEGMLCSEKELGIGDDASGLLVLPDEAEVGQSVAEQLGLDDAVIEFEIYPNRPDCLSVVGIAREISALTGAPLRLPDVPEGLRDRGGPAVDVLVEAPDVCPRYCAQVVEGVTIGPSPLWMQQRLRAAGMRPINNVVDVTNYVMLELGQPLHAFDLAKLAGPKIKVRRPVEGERIETLDGVERELDTDMLVIADAEKAVAIAGIMGGANSEVSDQTQNVLLEAANFHAATVRKMARRLGMQTEASLRFEKGLDPELPLWAIHRAAKLLAEVAGGKPSPVVTDASETSASERQISLRPERVNRVLGTDMSPAEMKRCLRALHFGVDVTGDARLQVHVPSYRRDITREIDLVEEIARIYGYDRIEPTLPKGSTIQGGVTSEDAQTEQLRQRLIGAGLSEVITYSFMSPRGLERLQLAPDDAWRRAIPIQNPLSEEMSLLRTNLMVNLLELVARNERRQAASVQVFELGSVFVPQELPLTAQPEEKTTLGIALMGEVHRTGWGEPSRQVDFFDLKGLVEAALEVLGVEYSIEAGSHPALHPGRSAQVVVEGETVGVLGEIHPDVTDAFDIAHRVYVAELGLETLLGKAAATTFTPIPRYPAVHRDIAFLAPAEVTAEDIERVITHHGGELLKEYRLFDVYQGAQIPEGYRSLAYAFVFQASDRTLKEAEVESVLNELMTQLKGQYGVKLRG